MSDEHEKQLITVDEEEFDNVLRRVHGLLMKRAERAQARKMAHPTPQNEEKHVETVKDVFALMHMIELVECMTEEISDLQQRLEHHHRPNVSSFEMFSSSKKNYTN